MGELKTYAAPTWWDRVKFATKIVFRVPVTICWTFTTNFHNIFLNFPKFKRAVLINLLRQLLTGTSPSITQAVSRTSLGCYLTWTKRHAMERTVEDLIDDTVLVWVGPKRRDRVILFMHGGAYLFPLTEYCLDFLKYVQDGLKDAGQEVGIAVLTYSLVPNAGMEVQMTQATRAVEHILASGVRPEDLHIAGDSAGAQLALAYFSHMLHPLKNVHKMKPTQRIGSLFLMSPWSTFTMDSPSVKANAHSDLFPASASQEYSKHILARFTSQPSSNPFTSPVDAPEGWFNGLDSLVDRVLVAAGSKELFCDDIKRLAEVLKKEKPNLTLVVEDGGVHNDPYIDFMLKMKPTGSMTSLVVHWYAEGLKGSS